MMSLISIMTMKELSHGIVDFLYFKDAYYLCNLVSNKIRNKIRKQHVKQMLGGCLKNTLNRFVLRFELDVDSFFECLHNINGVIAGGFATALFTGELNEESDIDVYVPLFQERRVHELEMIVRKSELICFLENNDYKVVEDGVQDSDYPAYFYDIINTRLKKKIQVLSHIMHGVYWNEIGKSIVSNYDFTTVMCYIETTSNKIIFGCENLHDVMNKVIKINTKCQKLNYPDFPEKTARRVYKYKNRGYTICDSVNFCIPSLQKELSAYEDYCTQ